MPKQQTKYNRDWENCSPWLKPTSTSYSAKCVACKKGFEIGNSGLKQVESHSGSQTQIKRTDNYSQHKICISPSGNLSLSGAKEAQLSGPMQALRAEIIESLHKAEYNHSFSSSSDDGERLQLMFPGHPAALNYQCSSTKTAYLLRYGISEFVFEELKQDAANIIKFDETTINQVKKQLRNSEYSLMTVKMKT